jgi:MFS family permease
VFVSGALAIAVSIALCLVVDPNSLWFLPCYWLSGIGLGLLYPPLIGWLNQGDDAHANRQGVSFRLILFCVAWNSGMMCGQLTGGSLYTLGTDWSLGVALAVSFVNLAATLVAAGWVKRLPAVASGPAEPVHAAAALASAYKRLSWIANLGGVFGASLVIHLLPDVMASLKISPDEHGGLLAGWRAVIIATYLLMHYVGFWHYRMNVSLASQVLGALGLVVIAQAETAAMLLAGLTLQGQLVGYNYFSGLYYSTAGSSDEGRTLAAGIHEATLATGMAVGTIVGGISGSLINHRLPYRLAAGVIVVLIAAQLIAWWRWVRPLNRKRDP